MSREKYISINENVNGYSFANLGLFTGFASCIVNAVYSLVLLGIFKEFLSESGASAAVGVYASIYALFAVVVGIFSTEILHWFSKTKLLYFCLFSLGICYTMMSFAVKPLTFITIDYTTNIALTLLGILLPLFLSEFSKGIGMEKLNARLHLWANIGSVIAPMFAMTIVGWFGGNYRVPLLVAAIVYFSAVLFFNKFGIVQADKPIKRVNFKRTLRALRINAGMFFRKQGMLRAYVVNFGFFALRSMRLLYVPIIVIENGFTNETLGLILSLGIIPYVIVDSFIGGLIKKFGPRFWLTVGFTSFACFSLVALLASGYTLLFVFVLWQISGALMETSHDLLFFNGIKKSEQSRYYGIFRTSVNFPSVVAPMLGTICITIFGHTSAVWLITFVMAILSTILLWSKK